MNSVERKQEILRELKEHESVEVIDLASKLGVSNVTIRADLDALASKGLIIRTHGGAVATETNSIARLISTTIREYATEKDAIAKEAVKLISDGDTIIIDNGSTTSFLSKYLFSMNLTVATVSLMVINDLMNNDNIDLIILGGTLRRYSMGAIGPITRNNLQQIHANWLFLGATAISSSGGITTSNLVEADTKRAMIQAADRVCLLADSAKLSLHAMGKVADWDAIDYLITDSNINSDDLRIIEEKGVKVIIAK